MRVADTSALIGFFNTLDEHHPKARRALAEPGTIIVPSEVLTELLLVLARRVGSAKAAAAGAFLMHQPNLEVQPSDTAILMAAWAEHEEHHRQVSFTDCVVIAWCREHDATPLAYDRDLLRALRG